jgi:nucleoporin GLE1
MRFSPYRDPYVPDLASSPSSSDEEEENDDAQDSFIEKSAAASCSPFISSPLRSMLDSTPSKPNRADVGPLRRTVKTAAKKRYSNVLYSSPLRHESPAVLTVGNGLDDSDADAEECDDRASDLTDLLSDLEIKERIGLISSSSPGERKWKRAVRMPVVDAEARHDTTPVKKSAVHEHVKNDEGLKVKNMENFVIDALESRLGERTKLVEETIEHLKRERVRIEREREAEQDRLRKEEEERLRKAEEKRKQEEEQLKKEAEMKRLKQEEEEKIKAKKQAEADELLKKQKAAEALQLQKAKEAASTKQTKGVTNFNVILTKFHTYKAKISDIKANILTPVNADKSLKSIISQHKRKINPKFGQLTNSNTQLTKITNELTALINQTKATDLAYKWILNFVSKAIVSQAETEVRAKPSSSIPLAKLTLNLLCEFPELKEYLLARFIKKCPYIIGHCVPLTNENEDASFREMAWRKHDDSWESQVSYDERMGGIATLFCVITRLPIDQRYFSTMKHPLPISNAWVFIARMLNTPRQRLTSTHFMVASAWWEACAREVLLNTGAQGRKLLFAVSHDWCALVSDEKGKYPASNTLQTLGEDWQKEGRVQGLPDMEP